MVKVAALLAALVITALCGLTAVYAAKSLLFAFVHWQVWVGLSLFFYGSIFMAAFRQKRRAERAAKGENLDPSAPLREL
jgi:hypothetical protein